MTPSRSTRPSIRKAWIPRSVTACDADFATHIGAASRAARYGASSDTNTNREAGVRRHTLRADPVTLPSHLLFRHTRRAPSRLTASAFPLFRDHWLPLPCWTQTTPMRISGGLQVCSSDGRCIQPLMQPLPCFSQGLALTNPSIARVVVRSGPVLSSHRLLAPKLSVTLPSDVFPFC